jgi:heat shock protein HslJ
LFALDRDGQRITGDRAALYRLAKIVADPRIEDTRWELVELNGRPLAPSNEHTAPFLELDGAESRVTGNASCNRFFGSYDLTANERLQFAPNMASTMMACPELEREREFLEMLGRVDSYGVADGTLSLLRARMAPLARFRRGDD